MSTVKIKCLSAYSKPWARYYPGQVVSVSVELAEFLFYHAAGCFEYIADHPGQTDKALDDPPKDKMMRKPARKK